MTDRVGELIPDDRCLIGEGTLSIGFSTTGWETENASVSGRPELTGRSVDPKKVRDVRRRGVI